MDKKTITEAGLIEALRQMVTVEKEILPKLDTLEFDQEKMGFEKLREPEIARCRYIFENHDELVGKLEGKISSPHMSPSLEEIRDVAFRILGDFGLGKDEAGKPVFKPQNAALKALNKIRETYVAEGIRMNEQWESLSAGKQGAIGEHNMTLFDTLDRESTSVIEAQKAADENHYNKEPGISSGKLWDCMVKAYNVMSELKELHGERWWDGKSQQIAR